VDDLPHRFDLGLAMAVAEMGKNIDRSMGDEIDVVAATSQCAFEIASVKRIEKIQDTLSIDCVRHLHLHRGF
jgi:hypothetical protein